MEQRTSEWMDARAGRITASNFGAAMGVSPYKTRQQLWRELTGRAKPFEGNHITQYGEDHEPDAVAAYEERTGYLVISTGFHVYRHADYVGCSPDGLVGADGLIEIKCRYNGELFKEIPPHYLAQVQGQLEIMNRDWCDFVSWNPEAINIIRVEKDPLYIEQMLDVLHNFWFEYVIADKEPPRKKRGKQD